MKIEYLTRQGQIGSLEIACQFPLTLAQLKTLVAKEFSDYSWSINGQVQLDDTMVIAQHYDVVVLPKAHKDVHQWRLSKEK